MPDVPADYDPIKVLEIAVAKGWIIPALTSDHGNYIITKQGLIELWKLLTVEEKA